jgi:hypothetical protein
MNYFEFADKYFEKNKDIFNDITKFADKRQLNLFDRLRTDNNEVNFLSWLSEMKFGLKLNNFFSTIFYDKPSKNLTG